jgi:hypothetical protein
MGTIHVNGDGEYATILVPQALYGATPQLLVAN